MYIPNPELLGSPLVGSVDGVFSSGYLATLTSPGGFSYRAVLFSPNLVLAPPSLPLPPGVAPN